MLEDKLDKLIAALDRNSTALEAVLAEAPKASPAPEPKAEKPAPAPKKTAPAPKPELLPDPEPEKQDEADPDLDDVEDVVTVAAVTAEQIRNAVQPRLAEPGFKEKFKSLRIEYKIQGISELTDEQRGGFLTRINAL